MRYLSSFCELKFSRFVLAIAFAACARASYAQEHRVFAAGSLRQPFNELIERHAQRTGVRFIPTFGPSGKLREEIEHGNAPGVFASASLEHSQALAARGLLRGGEVLTRNSLCLLAAPGISLDNGNLIDRLLDPSLRLGTSTPGADPAGDYTWQLFKNIDRERSGAFTRLERRAQKLTGDRIVQGQSELPYISLFREKRIDLFVAYCTAAVTTAAALPGVTWRRFDDAINVAAEYGIGLSATASSEDEAFFRFVLGPEG